VSVIALTTQPPEPTVVTNTVDFNMSGTAILIQAIDPTQLRPDGIDCNTSYDLRVGNRYRDYRDTEPKTIRNAGYVEIPAHGAVIIRTKEEVAFPAPAFGHILPKVSLLQRGIANTPTKIDPGYRGPLLITTFNHGRRLLRLQHGEPFCSMYVTATQGPIVPYNKPGKDPDGEPQASIIRVSRDFLERNSTAIQGLHGIITLLLAVYVFVRGSP
jgi:dCTP deaminase